MAQNMSKVAAACAVGQIIEWYDFFVYGTASALVFSKLFFPAYDPLAGTLLSFATFTVGFLARPLGGILFGHLGDRLGRKPTLVFTFMLMGISTGAVGLLPTYATIGALAPVVLTLLRVVQGLSLGGEYGGAVLMSVEHAAPERRGYYGSWVQAGSPGGVVLANGAFLLLATSGASDALLSWAWRVPFLFSFVLVVVGIVVRLRLEESPAFRELSTSRRREHSPLLTVLKHRKRQVLLTAGTSAGIGATAYLATVFVLSWGTRSAGFDNSSLLWIILAGQALSFVLTPLFGHLADRWGYKRVCLLGIVGLAVVMLPWLQLVATGDHALALLGFLLLAVPYAAYYAAMAAFFAEVFETSIGYSGLSLGYQLGNILGGGVAPLVATALFAATGTITTVAAYMILYCLVAFASAALLGSARTVLPADTATAVPASD